MPIQPRSQCFVPKAEPLVGEENQSIALYWERSPGNKVDVHKDHGKDVELSAMCKCVQKSSALLRWDLFI